MKRIVIFCSVFLVFTLGCVGARKTAKPQGAPKSPGIPSSSVRTTNQESALSSAAEPGLLPGEEAAAIPMGKILAKTIFEGLVQTSYVRLEIVDQADPQKNFQLIIGDQARQQNFPWKIQTVQPGYFFIELPAGEYRFHSLTIPVGTTVATEPMDITFSVPEDKVVYLGTMKVLGTKDKIKLGGVPLLKPGFEYSVQILDEEPEARMEFEQRYQDQGEFQADLMKAQPLVSRPDAPN